MKNNLFAWNISSAYSASQMENMKRQKYEKYLDEMQ